MIYKELNPSNILSRAIWKFTEPGAGVSFRVEAQALGAGLLLAKILLSRAPALDELGAGVWVDVVAHVGAVGAQVAFDGSLGCGRCSSCGCCFSRSEGGSCGGQGPFGRSG